MPEALFVTPVTPAAGGNGLAMRAGLFLTGLARSFRVHCLVVPVFGGPGRSDGLVDRLAASFRVLTLAPSLDPVSDLAARLAEPAWRARATAVHPRPRLSQAATVAAAREVAVAAAGVDVVHVHRLYLLPFLDALLDDPQPGSSARPVVTVDVDDLDELAARRDGDDAEADAHARLGASYLPDVDCAITVSAGDAAWLAAHRPVRVVHVPNAVALPPVARDGAVPREVDHDLVFVGSMGYLPNAEAVQWLCGAVVPELPGVSLAIVGSDPPPAVEALGRLPGVTVVGGVADVAPWYERSRVAVVPVRRGGGTRIKLLEALAHERPVVSTTVGAEGLDLVAGRDGLLVADDPHAFAGHCRHLLADPAFARSLATAGRDLVARTATVDVVSERIDDLFRELTAGRDGPPVPDRLALLGGQLHRNRVAAEVCTALVDAGVGAVLLKGASFATWLYDSALERTSTDVDVLVDPVDEQAAARILDGLGFRTLHGRSAAMLLGHPAVEWMRGGDCVDLHRGRFWGITVPPETAWSVLAEHRETITLGGRPVDVLDEEGRALQLVVHAAASGPTSTRTRADLDRALERLPERVWQDAARLARELGAEAAFATGLGLTEVGGVLARDLGLVDPARWDRVASVDARLRAEGAPRFATGIARWMAEPRLGPRIAIATRVVVPTPSYLAQQFPWARRSSVHLACAYVAWLGVLARGLVPAVMALRRASRRRPSS